MSVILFNPRSANSKPRIPNSILSIAASIEGKFDYVIVDGNMEADPVQKILNYLSTGNFKYFGLTCMPGPQLKQAIPISKEVRERYPSIKIIWGGYFPSNQPNVVLSSGFVDFIVNGPGDKCFPELLRALNNNESIDSIQQPARSKIFDHSHRSTDGKNQKTCPSFKVTKSERKYFQDSQGMRAETRCR